MILGPLLQAVAASEPQIMPSDLLGAMHCTLFGLSGLCSGAVLNPCRVTGVRKWPLLPCMLPACVPIVGSMIDCLALVHHLSCAGCECCGASPGLQHVLVVPLYTTAVCIVFELLHCWHRGGLPFVAPLPIVSCLHQCCNSLGAVLATACYFCRGLPSFWKGAVTAAASDVTRPGPTASPFHAYAGLARVLTGMQTADLPPGRLSPQSSRGAV